VIDQAMALVVTHDLRRLTQELRCLDISLERPWHDPYYTPMADRGNVDASRRATKIQ